MKVIIVVSRQIHIQHKPDSTSSSQSINDSLLCKSDIPSPTTLPTLAPFVFRTGYASIGLGSPKTVNGTLFKWSISDCRSQNPKSQINSNKIVHKYKELNLNKVLVQTLNDCPQTHHVMQRQFVHIYKTLL